jgi:hypothetical protein
MCDNGATAEKKGAEQAVAGRLHRPDHWPSLFQKLRIWLFSCRGFAA